MGLYLSMALLVAFVPSLLNLKPLENHLIIRISRLLEERTPRPSSVFLSGRDSLRRTL